MFSCWCVVLIIAVVTVMSQNLSSEKFDTAPSVAPSIDHGQTNQLRLVIVPKEDDSRNASQPITVNSIVQRYTFNQPVKMKHGTGVPNQMTSFKFRSLNKTSRADDKLSFQIPSPKPEGGGGNIPESSFVDEIFPSPGSEQRAVITKLPKWVGRRQPKHKRPEAENSFDYISNYKLDIDDSTVETPSRINSSKHQKSSIRHRKSRKTFVRTRKSPKMRQRSQGYDYDDLITPSRETRREKAHRIEANDGSQSKAFDAGYQTPINSLKKNLAITPERFVLDEETSGVENAINDSLVQFTIEDQFVVPSLDESYDGQRSSFESRDSDDTEDVVTKFLRIIETQQSMGDNCTKGTEFNLGEGVVDRYAQERFRLEAEVAVNRANLYTRLWKYAREQVLTSPYLLHAEVLSLVEFDEDIFAAGNCYDQYEYESYELYCPFAHRMPDGKIIVKDLAVQYFYLTNGSEWFLDAKRSAGKVIERGEQFHKGECKIW